MSDGSAIEAEVMRTLLPRLRANSKAHILIRLSAERIEHLERVLSQANEALSLALSDVEWRTSSPTQKVIFKAHSAIDEAMNYQTQDKGG